MSTRVIAALCAAALLPWPAHAAESDELQSIRQQLDELKAAYEGRIRDLEARLQSLQQRLGTAAAGAEAAPPGVGPAAPLAAAEPAAAAVPAGVPNAAPAQGSASAFNPAISLILNGTYANLSRDPSRYRLQGFIPSGGEAGPGPRGFSLGESELGLAATIDPTFSGHLTAAITGDDRISVEEAVFERQGVFEGASLKVGRFLSSIGYLNSQHAHTWDFVDAPLAYQSMLGTQFDDDGVQVAWLAPTDQFFELRGELGRGRAYPGNSAGGNGAGSGALIAHTGGDIGESQSWRAGLSLLRARASDQALEALDAAGAPVTNAFTGTTRVWIADGVWKWAPNGNATRTNFKLQGEYLRGTREGTLVADAAGAALAGAYRAVQTGWYVQ
ncbi:MAG: hypothetical protein ACXWIZ_12995, partial [Caldimonas sp.]